MASHQMSEDDPPDDQEIDQIIEEYTLEEILMTEKLLAEVLKQDIANN
jgi:hypothetical protein